ncbi:hydroxyacid dehydrogenase [Paenibacillus sp. 1P07SE]|uniref:hydroxyacid dehydrogenase n=1 Tax=Paenibacillus sp. 1P07SE TaxID=3132209 RepID=UPI0039A47825
MKPKALVLPSPRQQNKVCSEACRQFINDHYEATWNPFEREMTETELLAYAEETEVVFTTWASPTISQTFLDRATNLKAIAHAAGSVKHMLDESIFDRGIRVFSANPRLALAVSEYCLGAIMIGLRHYHRFNAVMHEGGYGIPGLLGQELTGQTVGLVSAGATARGLIRMLQPFDVKLKIYDPFLSESEAAALNAVNVSLEEVMQCPVISVHAPKLASTRGMIGQQLLRLIPDGAVFINAARAAVIDYPALTEELKSGRFFAALDVFDQEPLDPRHELRQLDNVMLTPHIAGATRQGHRSLLDVVARDVHAALRGEATKYEIVKEVFARLA